MDNKNRDIDHLFRSQYGKMVSILTRMIGLHNLGLAEDAVQDTFIKAMSSWKIEGLPECPEAWLMTAAKNRAIDLIRKTKSDDNRHLLVSNGASSITMDELFLETEIEDSVLRMIFTACHPALRPKDQIAFALKTISGLSASEIATSLLSTTESIKKSLQRARKSIADNQVKFEIPKGDDLKKRLDRVHEVIYLIFNEGYHSINKSVLIRDELCKEAMRLAKILTDHKYSHNADSMALMALMCFHSARLPSRLDAHNQIIPLAEQDRTKWLKALIYKGNRYMTEAVETHEYSSYHYEAAIASEHLRADTLENTDWNQILIWYDQLYHLHPTPMIQLNKVIVLLQLERFDSAKALLDDINPKSLAKREYLYHSTYAEYYKHLGEVNAAIDKLLTAMNSVTNDQEKKYLTTKISKLQDL